MAHGVDAYMVGNEGREIFWNAPFPSELILFIFAGIAIAVCVYGFYRRWKMWKAIGQPENRTDIRGRESSHCCSIHSCS